MRKGGRGGGEEGKEARKAPKEGKRNIFLNCSICMTQQPSVKSMKIHYESKHPKEDWDIAEKQYEAQFIAQNTK